MYSVLSQNQTKIKGLLTENRNLKNELMEFKFNVDEL